MNRTQRLAGDLAAETANALGQDPMGKGVDRLAAAIAYAPEPRFVLTEDEKQHLVLLAMVAVLKYDDGKLFDYVEGLIDSRLSQHGMEDTNTMRRITSRCLLPASLIKKGLQKHIDKGNDPEHPVCPKCGGFASHDNSGWHCCGKEIEEPERFDTGAE